MKIYRNVIPLEFGMTNYRIVIPLEFGMTIKVIVMPYSTSMTNQGIVIPSVVSTQQVRYDNVYDCHTVPKNNINYIFFYIINPIIIHLIILII